MGMEGVIGKVDLRVVGTVVVALALGEANLIDAVYVGGIVHRLAEVVVEFGSSEPVFVVVVCVLHHALFALDQHCSSAPLDSPYELDRLNKFKLGNGFGEGFLVATYIGPAMSEEPDGRLMPRIAP